MQEIENAIPWLGLLGFIIGVWTLQVWIERRDKRRLDESFDRAAKQEK